MAELWTDDFDDYGSAVGDPLTPTGVLATVYPDIQNESAMRVAAGVSGYAVTLSGGYNVFFAYAPVSTEDTLIFGLYLNLSVLHETGYTFIELSGGGTRNLRIGNSNSVIYIINEDVSYNEASADGSIVAGVWAFLEFKIKTHVSAGAVEMRVNGSPVIVSTGVKTQFGAVGYTDRIRISSHNTGNLSVDDLYVYDNSGVSGNDFKWFSSGLTMPLVALGI
jgi:hypothetical protein